MAEESAAKPLPIVSFLKIPDDGDPYLEGHKCKSCDAMYLGERSICPSCRWPRSRCRRARACRRLGWFRKLHSAARMRLLRRFSSNWVAALAKRQLHLVDGRKVFDGVGAPDARPPARSAPAASEPSSEPDAVPESPGGAGGDDVYSVDEQEGGQPDEWDD